MTQQDFEKNLALAAVCQAAALAREVARTGECDEDAFATCINSIIIIDAPRTEDIFAGISGIKLGFKTLEAQLNSKPQAKDGEITRYIAGILGLERKLMRNSTAMANLGQRIQQAQRQSLHYPLLDVQMLENLASIYSDVISPIGPRIQVAGSPTQLNKRLNQHKIRALLLAGIRAAVLWRQLGGKRRQILFSRRKILRCAEHTLQRI